MKLQFFILFLFLIFSSIALAQNIDIQTKGICKFFDVTVNAQLGGCWDVKIDAPGKVLHPEGWKSSFFYVNDALCTGEAELKIELDNLDNITTKLKLRQNETIIEESFDIDQNCPDEGKLGEWESLLVVVTIIIILTAGIAIYTKKAKIAKKQKRKRRKRP